MLARLTLCLLLLSCSPQGESTRRRPQIDSSAFGIAPLVKPPAVRPAEVSRSRGASAPDRIDSLIASVLSIDAEFEDVDGEPPAFSFSGQNDSAFKELATTSGVVPRLVSCLGWDRRSRTTWHSAPVLAGAVCGHALRDTPYWQRRGDSDPWVDYNNPTIKKLRIVQARWDSVLKKEVR